MMNKISSLFKKSLRVFNSRYFPSEQDKVWKKWNKDLGDTNLIFSHNDLDKNSIVLDIGGFHGNFAAEIYARYACKIKVFEPVPDFVEYMRKRFHKNPDIEIYGIGLGGHTSTESMSINSVSSSVYRKVGAETIDIHIVNIVEWLEENRLEDISLMKINIEGGEYELLEKFIESKYIDKCNEILIQFHNFFPDAEKRMKEIQTKLSKTHELTFQYPFIWENWKLKK